MSKKISPSELAAIVTGLLIKPSLFSELDTPEQYQSFILDIAQVVADHCGGCIDSPDQLESDSQPSPDSYSSRYFCVFPDDRLPSINQNVWAAFDPNGWNAADHLAGADDSSPLAPAEVKSLRAALFGLLVTHEVNDGGAVEFNLTISDWKHAQGEPVAVEEQQAFRANVSLGNQTHIDLYSSTGDYVLGLMVEINHGTPAVHINVQDDDSLLHIHKAQGGLVITPDDNTARFVPAESDRHSYRSSNSLVIS
jgi:hypothetical protein